MALWSWVSYTTVVEVELQADCCFSSLFNKAGTKPPYQVACQMIDFFLSNKATALHSVHVDNESREELPAKGQ